MTIMYVQVFDADNPGHPFIGGKSPWPAISALPNTGGFYGFSFPSARILENPPGTFVILPITWDGKELPVGQLTVMAFNYVPQHMLYRDGGPFQVYLQTAFPRTPAPQPPHTPSPPKSLQPPYYQSSMPGTQSPLVVLPIESPKWLTIGTWSIKLDQIARIEWGDPLDLPKDPLEPGISPLLTGSAAVILVSGERIPITHAEALEGYVLSHTFQADKVDTSNMPEVIPEPGKVPEPGEIH